MILKNKRKSIDSEANVQLRGLQASAFDVRQYVELIEGRMFESGKNEMLVGRAAQQEFKGLDGGSAIALGRMNRTIVGTFCALNSMYSSVSSRGTEIATLRALGFGPIAVLVSTIIESSLLALIGGCLAGHSHLSRSTNFACPP